MCKRNHKPVAKAMGWHRFWFPLQISISVSVSGCLKGFRFQVQGLFQIWAPSLTHLLDTHLNRVLHSISLYCMVLNCIQLHCMVLHGSPPSPTCWTPTSSRLPWTEALQCLVSWTEHKQSQVKRTYLTPFTVGQAPCMVRSSLKSAGWKSTVGDTDDTDHDTNDTEDGDGDTCFHQSPGWTKEVRSLACFTFVLLFVLHLSLWLRGKEHCHNIIDIVLCIKLTWQIESQTNPNNKSDYEKSKALP